MHNLEEHYLTIVEQYTNQTNHRYTQYGKKSETHNHYEYFQLTLKASSK